MKRLLILLFLLFRISRLFAQSEAEKFRTGVLSNKNILNKELKTSLISHDFSKLFLHTDNSVIYGFIGDNYQRIRIKVITVIKDASSPDIYHVYGKSMIKNNVDRFNGTIKVLNIRKLLHKLHGCEDGYKFEGYKGEFVLLGNYDFQETKGEAHAGIFKGSLRSDFFITKTDQIRYNDIENCSDSYINNQFVGEWVDYKNHMRKKCNWGDFRIPNSGDFDIGAGEFSPGDKYLKYGWQSVRDMNKKIEDAKWWE